jgi:hypothetical protein
MPSLYGLSNLLRRVALYEHGARDPAWLARNYAKRRALRATGFWRFWRAWWRS